MHEIAARVERHYRFSKSELFRLSMTAFVAAFCLTLSEGWGFFTFVKEQSALGYLLNLVFVFAIAWVSLFIHFSAQKIVGLKLGYVSTYEYWPLGLILSVMISFLSFGFIPLFFTGSLVVDVNKKLRIGRFRYGIMQKDIGIMAFSGLLATMLAVLVAMAVYLPAQNPFLFSIIAVNLLIGLFSLIAIPTFAKTGGGTSGLYLLIASRWVFVMVATFFLVFSALALIAKLFSLIIALVLAILAAVIYYRTYESL